MKIAFCGTRGLPARYGGFETAVEEITSRLTSSGLDCEVFCRTGLYDERPNYFQGRKLVYVSGSKVTQLDTFISSIQTGWHLIRNRDQYQHIFWFNNANLPGILMTQLAGMPTSVNTDGLEWRRPKWSLPFKIYYIASSAIVSRLCKSIISDSRALGVYYRKRFGARSTFIPYGAPTPPQVSPARAAEILEEYGVESGMYSLQITRIEPDNLPVEIAQGFMASGLNQSGFKHLVIGYKQKTPYSAQLLNLCEPDNGLLVRPAVYDADVVSVLRRHCAFYAHGNSVGGTNPALLEAMALCPRILAIDSPFSLEALGDLGEYFTVDTLAEKFRRVLASPTRYEQLQRRVRDYYDWDAVADAYKSLAVRGVALYEPEGELESKRASPTRANLD